MPSERALWALAAAVAAALLVGLGILIDRQTQGPRPLELSLGGSGEMRVYVTGAVRRPGVYTIKDGDRILDAVTAAGGPAPEADLGQVNLARRLRDEDHVVVPALGERPPPQAQRININTAPAELLTTLPGLGDIRSRNIVASREREGPFRRPEELVERRLVPASVYERIKDRITLAGP